MTNTSLKEHYKALLYSLIETQENPIDKPIEKPIVNPTSDPINKPIVKSTPIPYSTEAREAFKKKLLAQWNKGRQNRRPITRHKF